MFFLFHKENYINKKIRDINFDIYFDIPYVGFEYVMNLLNFNNEKKQEMEYQLNKKKQEATIIFNMFELKDIENNIIYANIYRFFPDFINNHILEKQINYIISSISKLKLKTDYNLIKNLIKAIEDLRVDKNLFKPLKNNILPINKIRKTILELLD